MSSTVPSPVGGSSKANDAKQGVTHLSDSFASGAERPMPHGPEGLNTSGECGIGVANIANTGGVPNGSTSDSCISPQETDVGVYGGSILPGDRLDSHPLGGTSQVRSEGKRFQELRAHGTASYSRFERSGAIEDINEAISHWEEAMCLTTASHMDMPGIFNDLGCAYLSRFERSGKLPDLNTAIDYGAQAVLLTPDGHAGKPARLGNLASSYVTRFERLGELADLDKAMDCGARAVSLTPDDDTDKSGRLNNLGNSHRIRFLRLGEMFDLNQAIECGKKSVSLTPNGHSVKPDRLSNLGNSYLARFGRLGELPDIDRAIECGVRAVSLIPEGHTERLSILNNLGSSYRARFSHMGEVSDLNKAIECGTESVSLTPNDHADKPGRLNNLGIWHRARFGRLGELPDLNKAIEYGVQAVSLTPDGHASKSGRLNNLGNSYLSRFGRLSELADLNKAVDCGTCAVSLTPNGHASKPGQLGNLGILYRTRFERLGDLLDLNKSIECGARAASLTPDGHPNKPDILNGIGNSYQILFGRRGELADLNKAIEYGAQAVVLTPDNHADKPFKLNNLGVSYRTRFQHLGELLDLRKAVDCGAQAVWLTPKDHPERPGRLNNLANSYLIRFGHLADPADLTKAIEYGEEAVSLIPDSHIDKPGMLSNLGNSYLSRFHHLSDLEDANKAIECTSQAVLLTTDDHAGKPRRLNNLAVSYRTRFEHTPQLTDLDKAIDLEAQAVSLTLDGHAFKPTMLNFLGHAYSTRFAHSDKPSDLESAIKCLKDAAQSSVGSPSHRFNACRKWANLVSHYTETSPHPAYQLAMEILPQLIWVGTTLGRRYSLIEEVGDLAMEAASHAISTSNHELALEWLEAGRSIIWSQIAQLRTPFDQLSAHNPDLAYKLKEIGRSLDCAGSRSPSAPFLENDFNAADGDTGHHVQLGLDWDMYLAQARAIPGFGDFLRLPKASKLLSAARSQPIAVINIHRSRCDALILRPDNSDVCHVPLSQFSVSRAMAARQRLVSLAGYRDMVRENRSGIALEESMRVVWSGVVKPILEFLGYTHKKTIDQLPHLTWCTTGLLSFLPLHASGPYDTAQTNTFDLAISSYTPTLSALLESQSTESGTQRGILAVGQERTPGLKRLPFVSDELTIIKSNAQPECFRELKNDEATVTQVLDAMDQFSWVHMACHGSQDTANPTHSAFHLHDGRLTLEMLTKRSFKDKGLAFLSACQTATGDKKMPEEAVHLAAGMLMAGFPSVIGTMWSIKDKDGPAVAEKVYKELLKDGSMDHTKAARALHQAVAHLRAEVGVKAIERWAPFIHIGS